MIDRLLRPDGHLWLRVADPSWSDPLDATHAGESGGRWNPPGSEPALYLNRDLATARAQIQRLCDGAPFGPGDLTDDAYVLVRATLPRRQRVADLVSSEGLRSVRLAATYPIDSLGRITSWRRCQSIGRRVVDAGLDGIEARSAAVPDGAGRGLAWFTRGRSAVQVGRPEPYGSWRA